MHYGTQRPLGVSYARNWIKRCHRCAHLQCMQSATSASVKAKLSVHSPNVVPRAWRLYDISIPIAADPGKDTFEPPDALITVISKKLGLKNRMLHPKDISIVRKSFDAREHRGRGGKSWVYVVDIKDSALPNKKVLKEIPGKVELLLTKENHPLQIPAGPPLDIAISPRPSRQVSPTIVVGAGPAGLFAALEMAEAGLPVILLERGQPVESRGRDIGALFVRKQLSSDSNICFGEGGAGTYSDGKLTTRIGRNSDPVRKILETLFDLGAPESVMKSGKPHLGTDRVVKILRSFRARLQSLGVEIHFGAKVTNLLIVESTIASADNNNAKRVRGVELQDGRQIEGGRVVLAVGHSSRDMYAMLVQRDVELIAKPFAMGFRIEHPQEMINKVQYGEKDAEFVLRGKGSVPVAEYRLAMEVDANRGVYSFCMCPGGQIVPTSTCPDLLCINGMSFSKRDSKWANSALVVTVGPSDWQERYGTGPLAGVEMQKAIERRAAEMGGGNFVAPVQTAEDFLKGRTPTKIELSSSYRLGIKPAPLHELYDPRLTESFRTALTHFDAKMPGFAGPQALLHGVETRTSSPVRIVRNDDDLQSPSLKGLYPCGEGAGYAGGIVSAAVEGLKVGSAIVQEEYPERESMYTMKKAVSLMY